MDEQRDRMVHFVGAGPGAEDLITMRGARLLNRADVVIYAGSLVNPMLLEYAPQAQVYDSVDMTLEQITELMEKSVRAGKTVVRLQTGDPSLYGAIREQMDALDKLGIAYDLCPGVSACFGAAASLNLEYTLPGVSQSLIITRMPGKTGGVPERESIESFAAHGTTMAIYLSASMLEELSNKLVAGGYREDTPAAIIYKATWPEEKKLYCTVKTLAQTARENGITKMALILVGDVLGKSDYERSKLYGTDKVWQKEQETNE